jgi:hypothetical protein
VVYRDRIEMMVCGSGYVKTEEEEVVLVEVLWDLREERKVL